MRTFALAMTMGIASFGAAQTSGIDAARSKLTIKVDKTGFFSAFAHNHTIQSPIASGQLDEQKRTITLSFNTKEMKVLDPGVDESDRARIESDMKSAKVLDVERFPEIRFASTSVTPQEGGKFQVRGDLTLHGVTKPVEFLVALVNGRYSGSVKLKQTDFGITPISVAGGTVKVKDVIEVVFEIVPGK